MRKDDPKSYRSIDVDNCEERWSETGDAVFLALAIGRQPHTPPVWAVETCIALYDALSTQHDKGGQRSLIGRRLDEMWRFFLCHPDEPERDERGRRLANKGPSVRAAAIHALQSVAPAHGPESPEFEANLRTLQRAWRFEQQTADDTWGDFELFDELTPTRRMSEVFVQKEADQSKEPTAREAAVALYRREHGL